MRIERITPRIERITPAFTKWGVAITLSLSMACTSVFSVGNLHPSFTVKSILPTEFDDLSGIGGLDLLPNGDGVIAIWGGNQRSTGEMWIVPGLAAGTPGKPTRIASGMREPLGVQVVGTDFYVMEKSRIQKFTGSGTTWTQSTLWSLPTAWYDDGQWHHFSFNLILRDNHFWFATGTAYPYTSQDPVERGALIRVPLTGGGYSQFARGLRNTDGLGLGPENEFFATDNQGHWRPINSMYHLPTTNIPNKGRFFGFRTDGNNACGTLAPPVSGTNCPQDPEYPPAVWIPYVLVSNSPTRPILLKAGPYAGQMLAGDVTKGGIARYFVEKVNGEWQGAVLPFMNGGSGGVTFGINQFLYTPTGSLLVAGIGGGTCETGGSPNWNFNNTCRGLDLLTPTNDAPFEILAVRSIPGGFDVEFTHPVNAVAAANKANWAVKTSVFTLTANYGDDNPNSDNNVPIAVSSVTLSSDNRHARLQLASLETRRMYAITMNNIASATGEQAYNNVAYYTLNNVGPATAIGKLGKFTQALRTTVQSGSVSIDLPFDRPYQAALYDLSGVKLVERSGSRPSTLHSGPLTPGLYILSGSLAGQPFQEKIRIK